MRNGAGEYQRASFPFPVPCTDADGETQNSYTHAVERRKMQGLWDDQQWVWEAE